MAGGNYRKWETPRQLTEYKGEPLIARTIRQLRNYTDNIAISTNNKAFNGLCVEILRHENDYDAWGYNDSTGYWCNGFYPTENPACYLFGDVVFSDDAIRQIVEYETDDIMLFGSKPPFAKEYPKVYIEPFAFKVANQKHLREAIEEVKRLDSIGAFNRKPIAWELWAVICGSYPNAINESYVAINDYTCDIDYPDEIQKVLT